MDELPIDIHTCGIGVDGVTRHVVSGKYSSLCSGLYKLFCRRDKYFVQDMTCNQILSYLCASL